MSEKLPWFPMYAGDFLNSRKVRKMTAAQVGSYVLLMCEQWEGGPLPNDPAELARIGKTNQKKVMIVVEMCFKLTSKGWVNRRLTEVLREQTQKKIKASKNAKKAADARWERERQRKDADSLRPQCEGISDPMPIRTEENRADKKREETTTTTDDDGFAEFWKAYPKRAGGNPKRTALTRWRSAVKRDEPANIIAGAERYAVYCLATKKTGTEYVMQATTFLGEREGWTETWEVTEAERTTEAEVHPSVQFTRDWEAHEARDPERAGDIAMSLLGKIQEGTA